MVLPFSTRLVVPRVFLDPWKLFLEASASCSVSR
jgi:hypothetical protein